MFLDASPLVHQVNRRHKVKLQFPVCGRSYTAVALEDAPIFYSALGGLHSSGLMGHSVESLSQDQFFATPVLKLGPQVLRVQDLIDISANVLGGVHKGVPKTGKAEALAAFNRTVSVAGRTIGAAQLKPVILVALDGLQPLADLVSGDRQ
jgi:hypothetical protein